MRTMMDETRRLYHTDRAQGVKNRFSNYARAVLKKHGFDPTLHSDTISAMNSEFGKRGALVAHKMRTDGRLPEKKPSRAPARSRRFNEWLFSPRVSTH